MEACVADSPAWPACSLHDMCLERQPRTLNAVLSGCDVFLDEQSIIMDSMFHHLLALSYHQKPVCVHTDQNM